MLHSKFRGNQSTGSREDFEGFLPYIYMGVVAILVISSPYPRRLHIKFGFDWPAGLRDTHV